MIAEENPMRPVRELLSEGAPLQSVLQTMPWRSIEEQQEVWLAGLTKIATDLTRRANRAAGTVSDRLAGGQITGLFFDPLDVAEAYCRAELRRSRSREEGERNRQRWLMDILVVIGEARASGCATLAEYPGAADLQNPETQAE